MFRRLSVFVGSLRDDYAGLVLGRGAITQHTNTGTHRGIIANRVSVGPMHDCLDCAYEEFFLSSWAVGDPALASESGVAAIRDDIERRVRTLLDTFSATTEGRRTAWMPDQAPTSRPTPTRGSSPSSATSTKTTSR